MKFIYNAPAILYRKTIIVGDTHFGMEGKLRRKGIHAGDFSQRLSERLESLIREHDAERLIFLGDVKEEIFYVDRDTENILNRLGGICDIEIVRGNHDGGIERLGFPVHSSGGFLFGKLGLAHGHSWPNAELMTGDFLVLAHQHPMIGKTDSGGKYHSGPVWIIADPEPNQLNKYYDEFNSKIRLILMPAFNPLVGSAINSSGNRQLGPVLNKKLFKLKHALIYRLDGSPLGEFINIGD